MLNIFTVLTYKTQPLLKRIYSHLLTLVQYN